MARSRGEVTEFGKLADPIADKALMGAALIGLSVLGDLPWWVTVVILVREVGITVLRFAVLRHGVIPASRGGKLKTLVQAVAVGLFILPLTGPWHTARMGGDVGGDRVDGRHRRRLRRSAVRKSPGGTSLTTGTIRMRDVTIWTVVTLSPESAMPNEGEPDDGTAARGDR